jgi:hypothetical protein
LLTLPQIMLLIQFMAQSTTDNLGRSSLGHLNV